MKSAAIGSQLFQAHQTCAGDDVGDVVSSTCITSTTEAGLDASRAWRFLALGAVEEEIRHVVITAALEVAHHVLRGGLRDVVVVKHVPVVALLQTRAK